MLRASRSFVSLWETGSAQKADAARLGFGQVLVSRLGRGQRRWERAGDTIPPQRASIHNPSLRACRVAGRAPAPLRELVVDLRGCSAFPTCLGLRKGSQHVFAFCRIFFFFLTLQQCRGQRRFRFGFLFPAASCSPSALSPPLRSFPPRRLCEALRRGRPTAPTPLPVTGAGESEAAREAWRGVTARREEGGPGARYVKPHRVACQELRPLPAPLFPPQRRHPWQRASIPAALPWERQQEASPTPGISHPGAFSSPVHPPVHSPGFGGTSLQAAPCPTPPRCGSAVWGMFLSDLPQHGDRRRASSCLRSTRDAVAKLRGCCGRALPRASW